MHTHVFKYIYVYVVYTQQETLKNVSGLGRVVLGDPTTHLFRFFVYNIDDNRNDNRNDNRKTNAQG